MRKTIVLGGLAASLALSITAFAASAGDAPKGWKTMSSAESCVHNGHKVKMYTINGEMRKTQCFTLQSKMTASGKRVFQHVSRDGSITKKGRRLV
tara:strand:- start:4462 stop:4746 length:285 start_codon:yes stop_codon:yes gene_type:complete